MFKKFITANFALAAALLICSPANAADEPGTIKVENGVTVKAGTPPAATDTKPVERVFMKPIIDEKAVKKTDEPTTTKFLATEEKKTEEKKPEEKKVESKPVEKKEEKKTVAPVKDPFKKSQDAGVAETVKKPEPTPEVTSRKLDKDEDLATEIKNLDRAKAKEGDKPVESGIGESGLPIPRFVSLKSGEANARTGPGETYPIRWVYQRKHLPVEITAEFKLWRRIKDVDGEQSWVHQALLSSNRYAILNRDAVATSEEDGTGDEVARFKKGVQVKVPECQETYCEVEYGRIEGYVKKKDLWGIYADEKFD